MTNAEEKFDVGSPIERVKLFFRDFMLLFLGIAATLLIGFLVILQKTPSFYEIGIGITVSVAMGAAFLFLMLRGWFSLNFSLRVLCSLIVFLAGGLLGGFVLGQGLVNPVVVVSNKNEELVKHWSELHKSLDTSIKSMQVSHAKQVKAYEDQLVKLVSECSGKIDKDKAEAEISKLKNETETLVKMHEQEINNKQGEIDQTIQELINLPRVPVNCESVQSSTTTTTSTSKLRTLERWIQALPPGLKQVVGVVAKAFGGGGKKIINNIRTSVAEGKNVSREDIEKSMAVLGVEEGKQFLLTLNEQLLKDGETSQEIKDQFDKDIEAVFNDLSSKEQDPKVNAALEILRSDKHPQPVSFTNCDLSLLTGQLSKFESLDTKIRNLALISNTGERDCLSKLPPVFE